jgi:hypothetical protein
MMAFAIVEEYRGVKLSNRLLDNRRGASLNIKQEGVACVDRY